MPRSASATGQLACRATSFVLAMALLGPASLHAADLQVAPTLVTVPADRNAEGLQLRNSGQHPVYAQVRVFAWQQVDGEDRLVETQDVAISPPMLEIPPGAEQLVRIVRLGPAPATLEASYRVVVDELPGPARPAPTRTGLNFVLRYSIPVFMEAAAPTAPVLQARIEGGVAGRHFVLDNTGSARAQVADLVHAGPQGTHSIANGLAGYVLPGQQRRWPLPFEARPGPAAEIQARINGEPDARSLLPDR